MIDLVRSVRNRDIIQSVRDGNWLDPGTWSRPLSRDCQVVVNHVVTLQGVLNLPIRKIRKHVEGQPRHTKDEVIRAYRLYNPNRWNMKMAAWRAKR